MKSAENVLERVKGFEPSTSTLARLRSTPELHPRIFSTKGRLAVKATVLQEPGGDLVSHILRCSTIGAERFHF